MAFKTGKFIISGGDSSLHSNFLKIEDVPRYEKIKDNKVVCDFILENLSNKSICIQAAKYESTNPIIHNNDGNLVALHGWHLKQFLGQGKDGITFLGYQYEDDTFNSQTVKVLSNYAKEYLNYTEIFSELFSKIKNKSSYFYKLNVTENYTFYNNSKPLTPIDLKNLEKTLIELCKLNHWAIKNTGFVFWDFGFGSGLNYMQDSHGNLKWIDYGGSGMSRCSNFESIYQSYSDLPELTLLETKKGKENLLEANSNFIMCQFLLHYEYWKAKQNSTADVWSSMIQIKKELLPEMVDMIPRLLYTKLSQSIFNNFKNHNWTDEITWKQVGKHIDANT
jgi:hypothetical protein